jgi:hypothetical protein
VGLRFDMVLLYMRQVREGDLDPEDIAVEEAQHIQGLEDFVDSPG